MAIALGKVGLPSLAGGLFLYRLQLSARIVLLLINIAGIAALLVMILTQRIDDDTSFQPPVVTEGGLASVDMTVALIEREVRDHGWVPNDPAFLPGAWLRNMDAYQRGIVYGLSRYAFELADTVGRTRGTTSVDPDLDRAAGLLRFPADVWVFDFEKTWAPTVTSEEQYLSAARALESYNRRIAAGEAQFDPRIDNLHAALSRFEADISSKVSVVADHVEAVAAGAPISISSNEVLYNTKGRLYAYTMILKAMRQDFAHVIDQAGLGLSWDRMIVSFENASALRPFYVTDSPPGSIFVPSHVAELGFFALRSQSQLRDVMEVLRGA